MSRPLRLEFPGAVWHVTSRGNERRNIARDALDCRRFVSTLGGVVTERRWLLHAWVLMSNHYHLLVETPEIGLSRGIKDLNQDYASSFNKRHDRVGHLFQGRFKAILVEREAHLHELARYIVLNPVRAGMVRFAGEYAWSNYRATAGLRPPPSWLEVSTTLQRFALDRVEAQEAYRRFVADGRGASYAPWESLIGQIYLGTEDFRDAMQRLVATRSRSAQHPTPQRQWPRLARAKLESAVVAEFGVSADEWSTGCARNALVLVAVTDGRMSQREIGAWLGVTKTTIANVFRASRKLCASDAEFRERIDRVRARLGS